MSDIDIKSFLHKIDALIDTTHVVKAELSLSPKKEHIVTCLKYQGLNQMRPEFIRNLANSIVKYVLSKSKIDRLKKELVEDGNLDEEDFHGELFQLASQYFRQSEIKGQFSELLLFNFLQHYFEAIPVVRKMTITTNTELERNGCDAIHLAKEGDSYCIYLGEAKTYPSGFKLAFQNAIKSIIKTYYDHRNELQLYKYEEFLEPEIRTLMKQYLNGTIDLPVKLAVIISYCVGEAPEKQNKDEFHQHYLDHVLAECCKIKDSHYKDERGNAINPALLKEINYIIFPVNELEKLLEDFKIKLGIK